MTFSKPVARQGTYMWRVSRIGCSLFASLLKHLQPQRSTLQLHYIFSTKSARGTNSRKQLLHRRRCASERVISEAEGSVT